MFFFVLGLIKEVGRCWCQLGDDDGEVWWGGEKSRSREIVGYFDG